MFSIEFYYSPIVLKYRRFYVLMFCLKLKAVKSNMFGEMEVSISSKRLGKVISNVR